MWTSYTYEAPPQKGFKTSTTQQPLPALKLVYRAHILMSFKEQILIYLCYKAKNHTDNFLKQESPDCGPRGPSLQVSQPTTTSTALKKGEMQQTTWTWQSHHPSVLPRQKQNCEKRGSFTWPHVNTSCRIKKKSKSIFMEEKPQKLDKGNHTNSPKTL